MNKLASNYAIITWPFIQHIMDIEGFEEHSYLVNDEKGLEDFGPSAYFVHADWLNTIVNKL